MINLVRFAVVQATTTQVIILCRAEEVPHQRMARCAEADALGGRHGKRREPQLVERELRAGLPLRRQKVHAQHLRLGLGLGLGLGLELRA